MKNAPERSVWLPRGGRTKSKLVCGTQFESLWMSGKSSLIEVRKQISRSCSRHRPDEESESTEWETDTDASDDEQGDGEQVGVPTPKSHVERVMIPFFADFIVDARIGYCSRYEPRCMLGTHTTLQGTVDSAFTRSQGTPSRILGHG